MKKVVVKQDKDDPVETEVIARSIEAIAKGVQALQSTRLNDAALVLLITAACPAYGPRYSRKRPTSGDVKSVLEGLTSLEREWLKPKKQTAP